MATSGQWFRGCALGCGGVVVLVIVALVVAGLVVNAGGSRTIKARERLEARVGTVGDFTPWADGAVPADRLERYLSVRRALAAYCDEFTRAAAEFHGMQELDALPDDQRPRGREMAGRVGRALRGMGRVVGNLHAYLLRRNELLLEQEMSLGEWTFLHAMVYYSLLGHSPQSFALEDAPEVPRIYTTRVAGEVRAMIARHAEDPRAVAEDPDHAAWAGELERLRDDPARIPFADGLPPRLAASLAPYRAALEALWCPATDELDLSITKREGIGFEHI